MSTPILTTKLYIPPPRPNVVLRPRLIVRLNAGLHHKLTLISAPAGFGKTTLASAWIAECGRPAAWLSLDEADNDPTRLLGYLVAALQKVAPTIGAGVVGLLQSPQSPPIDALLPLLVNEIAKLPQPALLVLDDYHVLDARPIDQALAFLVEHLPPQLHLVITTREDPQLPLARLRARGQLTELRAADLRFTRTEAGTFLEEVMGLSLSAAHIAALEIRTEGWIAGLQLAALSMQGHHDLPSFIRTFAGDNRYIVDYLVEEVLHLQPERVRSFLLQTAILDRLHGPLCDAVTGQSEGTAQLEALERGNFFVVPLDSTRQWYRYHHLFADVLAAHLNMERPDLIATLHRRASAWYEQHGSMADAIRHALAGQDFVQAANLIERAVPAMRSTRQEATVLAWLRALPDDLLRFRPVLSAAYAWVLLASGEHAGVEGRLRDAERWLGTTAMSAQPDAPSAEMVVVDDEQFRLLPGTIAVWRSGQALALGDVAETVTYARRALEIVPEDDHLMRGSAAALLGIAAWTSGDLVAAQRGYAEGMAWMERSGHIAHAIGCAIALADIQIAQGHLRKAMRTYERMVQLATAPDDSVVRGTVGLYVGISELQYEQNNLHAARQHLLRSQELGEHTGLPQHRYRWRVAMACVRQAEGDLDGALDLLQEAERLYVPDFMPHVRPVAALKTRVWLAQGRLGEALGWAREQGLSAQDELGYEREFEHLTLARVLLARAKSDRSGHSLREPIGLLQRLLHAAEAGERTGSVIETLVLLSLAHQAHGDIPAACTSLERALMLAEPEGYVRMFVDEGPPMSVLIAEWRSQIARRTHVESDHQADKLLAAIDTLLAAFPRNEAQASNEPATKDQSEISNRQSACVEPLSERELDVLRLLGTYLSGPDIARELMVSLNTVRTHTKNIYDKLGVNSRQSAVRRAKELGLF